MLHSSGGARWWSTARETFSHGFQQVIDAWLETHPAEKRPPSFSIPLAPDGA